MLTNPRTVRELASEFARLLRDEMPPDQYAAAIAANARDGADTPTCHTHDYIDSGETMETAWREVTGRPSDPNSETDSATIDAAWTLWKHWTIDPPTPSGDEPNRVLRCSEL